jgi:hypothetical protein
MKVLVQEQIKNSKDINQKLVLVQHKSKDIELEYYFNNILVFRTFIFEYICRSYEYSFYGVFDNVNNFEDFFDSFLKVKKYIASFIVDYVNINDSLNDFNIELDKEAYLFFIKEYEIFM